MKKVLMIISSLCLSQNICAVQIHTWHDVMAKQGTWAGRLSSISQKSIFVDEKGQNIKSFQVIPGYPFKYGFGFNHGADFDIAYTLTMVEQSKNAFTSKACVFVITAKGPARPDIQALSYNGASCESTVVKGVGENFYVG